MNPQSVIWALGPHDPEMRSIRHMLKSRGYRYAYAQRMGRRCVSSDAYQADDLTSHPSGDEQIVWVECRSPLYSQDRDMIIDHHNPGDPGYYAGPSAYWEGSSIGQAARLLGVDDPEYRLVAASDHCLSAAMRGECPGISPAALMSWRITARAAMANMQPWLLRRRIDHAVQCIQALPRVSFGGESIVDATFVRTPELRDAAAVAGLAIMTTRTRGNGQIKVGLYGARPAVVSGWLDAMRGSTDVDLAYGCPNREYAGAVLNREASARMTSSLR